MKNNDTITVFKEVSVSISGKGGTWNPPVSSVVIRLKAGGLPTISATVDGAHQSEPGQENGVDAKLVTFSSLKRWHDHAQAYVADPTTRCSVSIKISVNGKDQSVSLSDWLLVAAGFGGVSTTGGCTLEIMMQHPAGQIDRCGGVLGNKIGEKSSINWDFSSFTNPVAGLAKAAAKSVDWYAELPLANGASGEDIKDAYEKTEADIVAKAALAEELLKWLPEWPGNSFGYSDLPLSNTFLKEHVEAVQSTFIDYVDGLTGTSLWSTFVDSICPDFDVTVMPTYWEPHLQVVPFTPYGNPVSTIFDDEISGVQFPAVDPSPVGGAKVSISGNLTVDEAVDFIAKNPDPSSPMRTTDVIYLGNTGDILGKIVSLGVPSWLIGAKTYEGGQEPGAGELNESSAHKTDDDVDFEAVAASTSVAPKVPFNDYADACYAYAQAEFMARAMENSEINLSTALLLKSDSSLFPDKFTTAGCVVRLIAKSDGADVPFLDMYVTEMVHVIDAQRSDAHTEIVGSYCRPVESGLSGTPNPLYGANAGTAN